MAERGYAVHPGHRSHHLESSHAEHTLQHFVDSLAHWQHLKVAAPPNTVVVEPGGKTFTSIVAAIASITDAAIDKRYMVNVGTGTWEERVVLKPWIILSGALDAQDEPATVIRKAADAYPNSGTVVAAPNSSIQNVKVVSYGTRTKTDLYAVVSTGADPFAVNNCLLSVDNQGVDIDGCAALAIDFFASPAQPSNVWVSYTQLAATATATDDYPVAMGVGGNAIVQVNQSGLVANGRKQSAGAAGYDSSNVMLNMCKVTGQTGSIVLPFFRDARWTARKCQLTGPVDPNVKVIP